MSDNADAAYTPSKDVPTQAPQDNTYAKFSNQEGPDKVQVDSVPVEDPIDPKTADSDAQLERDDKEAIDKSNIIGKRTRGSTPKDGYRDPGEDDLPKEVVETGQSST